MRDAPHFAGENYIVLDAGDPFQGSLFFTTYGGAAEAKFMEALGYDVMAVGNHEFVLGPSALEGFADTVSFPVISGNLYFSGEPRLQGKVANHAVLEVGGQTIVDALENSASEIEEVAGRFPQVAGLTYSVDTAVAPLEGCIRGVMVKENGQWSEIDLQKLQRKGKST